MQADSWVASQVECTPTWCQINFQPQTPPWDFFYIVTVVFTHRRFQNGGWLLGGFWKNMGKILGWMEQSRSNKNISGRFHSWNFQLWFYVGKWDFILPPSWCRFHIVAILFDGGNFQGENKLTTDFFLKSVLFLNGGSFASCFYWKSYGVSYESTYINTNLILKLNILWDWVCQIDFSGPST